MEIREFQKRIEEIYFQKDSERGLGLTYMWFVEEVGELARALRRGEKKNLQEEFADCFAWLSTLASIAKVDLEQAITKYIDGCPRCSKTPCGC